MENLLDVQVILDVNILKDSKYYIEGITDAFFKEKLIDVLVDGPFILDKKDDLTIK